MLKEETLKNMCGNRVILSVFVLLISSFLVSGCEYGEIICLKDKLNDFLKTKAQVGDEVKNIVPLDPLKISKSDIILPPDNGNFLNLFLTSHQVAGLGSATVLDISGFGADIAGPHSITVLTPKLSYSGAYDLDMSLAGIAAKGTGQSVISFIDCTITITFTGADNGKGYMLMKDVEVDIDAKAIELNFVGISEEINANLNKFALKLLTIVKPGLVKALGITFKEVVQPILDTVPYNDIFK